MSVKPDYWESVSSDEETFSEFDDDEEEQAQNQQWLVEMAKRGLQDDQEEESEEMKAGMHIEIIKVTKEPTPLEKSSFKKPGYTFGELAEMALLDRNPSSLQEIYKWIENRYPWYKWCALPKWRVSLRASLCNGAKFRSIVPSAKVKQATKFSSKSQTIVNFWTLRKGKRAKSRRVLAGECGKKRRTDSDIAKREELKDKLKERKKEQNERIEQITNPTSSQKPTVKKVVPKAASLSSARKSFEKLLKKRGKPRKKVPKPLELSDSELCVLDAELVRTLSTESDDRFDGVEDVSETSENCGREASDELNRSEDHLEVSIGGFSASGMANFVRTDIAENRDSVDTDHVLQTFCNGLELLKQLEQNSNMAENEDFDASSNLEGFLPDIVDMENPGSETSTSTLNSNNHSQYPTDFLDSSSTLCETSAGCVDTPLVTMDNSLVAMDTSLVTMDTSLGTIDTASSDPVAMDTAYISLNTPVSMDTVYSSPVALGAVAKDNFRSVSPEERPKDSVSATKLIESLYASIAAVENENRIASSSSLLDCIKTKDGLLSSTIASRSEESLDAPSFTNLISDISDFPELGLEMSSDLLSGLFDL